MADVVLQPASLAEQAREWAAVLATLALSAMAAGVGLVLWLGPWSSSTEEQRIGFLGAALVLLICLVGLGVSWLWKVQLKSLEVRAGLVQVSLQSEPG